MAPTMKTAATKNTSATSPASKAKRQKAIAAAPRDGVKPKGRQPRERDPERTSAAIFLAARKEFTEKGYGGARINEIARRANINKRMLYHYFGGKDALYLAVLVGSYVAIRSAEKGLRLETRDPVDGMRELVLFTWQYFLDHPEFLSLLSAENLHKAKFLKRSAQIYELHFPFIAQISDLLRRGTTSGVFRGDADAVKVYISIAALGIFYLSNQWTLSTIFRRNLSTTEEMNAWGEHMVDVILSYLR